MLKNGSTIDFDARSCSLESMSAAIDARDTGTQHHCDRTRRIALALGERLGLGPREMELLELAAHFHDIGKIGIPDRILHYPGRLSDEDRAVMKAHPELGEKIFLASHHPDAVAVARIIRHHHEAMDGSGYPDGLRGEAIPLAARILRVADSYDAIVSRRAYKDSLDHEEAMRLLRPEVGDKIDPEVFAQFEALMQDPAQHG